MNNQKANKSLGKLLVRPESLLNFGGGIKVPSIIQSESAECGLACLAMILCFNGLEVDMNTLRRKFPVSTHGTSLRELMAMAAKFNLAPRALKGEIKDLEHVQLPCVLHWNMNHFVVLVKAKSGKYVIHDPACGQRIVNAEDFGNQFTGVVLELTPTPNFEKGSEKETLRISHFWSSIVGLKRSVLQVLTLSLLLQFFNVASPFYMQTVVDDVLLRKDNNLLVALTLGFTLLMFISIGTSLLREFVILHFSTRLNIQMSANLFRHLIRLPMDYFSKRHVGDVVSRFGSLGQIRNLLTYGLVAAVVDGLMAVITLTAMFLYDTTLSFVVISILLIYALLRWVFYHPLRIHTEEKIIASAKESSHFMESIRGIQTIKLFQRENDRQGEWQNRLANTMNKDIKIARWNIGYSALRGLLFGTENLLVSFFAAKAVMNDQISLGMFYAFLSYKTNFISSMDSLIGQFVEFKMLGLYMNRLADIAYSPIEKDAADEINDLAPVEKFRGKIEVRNLSFRYTEASDYVFEDVSFIISPGETVVLTGPSGCGKSTLLKCLMGLIVPTSGEILIDEIPLTKLANYRSRIAGVMQDDQLLSGDIAENIASFSNPIDVELIKECARMASIEEEIIKMPMRFHTLVGDMGTSLSGGQKQRVILARALYRSPDIIFLDEATSHLDADNESIVNRNIAKLNITRVIVAHRAETIRNAGREIRIGFPAKLKKVVNEE